MQHTLATPLCTFIFSLLVLFSSWYGNIIHSSWLPFPSIFLVRTHVYYFCLSLPPQKFICYPCISCFFVISACGMNFAYSGQITALNHYFYKRHSIATSTAMLGIGLGIFFLVSRQNNNLKYNREFFHAMHNNFSFNFQYLECNKYSNFRVH